MTVFWNGFLYTFIFCILRSFVLRVEIATIFEPKDTIIRKFANFARLYVPHITAFFNQILEFYYFYIKGSFREFRFY